MGNIHKVFISFHSEDLYYKEEFVKLFHRSAQVVISRAVDSGDIQDGLQDDTIRQKIRDEHLRDSSVTIVLVGEKTWQRKHVDWEISSSIRDTIFNPRSGLLGLLLPTYPGYYERKYNKYTIPPRLSDNIECDFAKLYCWTDNPEYIQKWVHEAYLAKRNNLPDNSYPSFVNNRFGARWY